MVVFKNDETGAEAQIIEATTHFVVKVRESAREDFWPLCLHYKTASAAFDAGLLFVWPRNKD